MRLDDDFEDDFTADEAERREQSYRQEASARALRSSIVIIGLFVLITLGVVLIANKGKSPSKGNASARTALESEEAAKSGQSVEELISGSTLTASDLDFWDDYPEGDGKDKIVSADSATPSATPEPEDPATDGKHTLITHSDGSEEWIEINPYLQRNQYENAGFVYQKPFMKYYENNSRKSYAGVDISKDEDYVDFARLKSAGIDFVMLRLGQRGYASGEISLDEKFLDNYTRAREAGLDRGVYCVTSAVNTTEAYEEATFVRNTISENAITLEYPVALSGEKAGVGKGRTDEMEKIPRTNCAITFMKAVEDAGYYPIMYGTKETLIQKYSLGSMIGYEFWLSEASDLPSYPYTFTMWEYDLSGEVDGIAGGARMILSFEDYSMR